MGYPVPHPTERVPELVRKLYEVVAELESLFPGQAFTPDGHVVGSIGEVIAAHKYGLILNKASSVTHDAVTLGGQAVQIKIPQGSSVALRGQPEHLIVLRLAKDGTATEVFNGPGEPVWLGCGKLRSNGQRTISLARLRKLMQEVSPQQRLGEAR